LAQLNKIRLYIEVSNDKVSEVNLKIEKLDFDNVPEKIDQFERIGWFVILFVLCTLAIIGLMFLFSVFSRCLLKLVIFFGLLALIMMMITVAIFLGIGVVSSDFCIDAKPIIKTIINQNLKIDSRISEYYIDCNASYNNILNELLNDAINAIVQANHSIDQFRTDINDLKDECSHDQICDLFKDAVDNRILKDMESVELKVNHMSQLVSNLIDLIKCDRINNDINESLSGVCYNFIEGIFLMLINGMTASFCFTLLLFCSVYI
jgi:hypothetical protein